jgi:hypothetical protein
MRALAREVLKSKSFWELLTWRLVTDIGDGGAYLPAMALPPFGLQRDLERATGCVSAGVGVGIALMGVVVPAVLLGHGEAD